MEPPTGLRLFPNLNNHRIPRFARYLLPRTSHSGHSLFLSLSLPLAASLAREGQDDRGTIGK